MSFFGASRKKIRLLCLQAACFVYCMCCGGCGLVADSITLAQTVQLPPERIFSPEFYKKATPEEVRAALKGRQAGDLVYTEKWFDWKPGMFTDRIITAFLPSSEVHTYTHRPLHVAVLNSPHPEVIFLLIDAGARVEDIPMGEYLWEEKSVVPAVTKKLFERASRKARCMMIKTLSPQARPDVVAYCLNLDTSLVAECANQNGEPLHTILKEGGFDVAKVLLDRGVPLPGGQYGILKELLRKGDAKGFQKAISLGVSASNTYSEGGNDLLTSACAGPPSPKAYSHMPHNLHCEDGIGERAVYLYLAKNTPATPMDATNNIIVALKLEDEELLKILLRRHGGLAYAANDTLRGAALKAGKAALYHILLTDGFTYARTVKMKKSETDRLYAFLLTLAKDSKDEKELAALLKRLPYVPQESEE